MRTLVRSRSWTRALKRGGTVNCSSPRTTVNFEDFVIERVVEPCDRNAAHSSGRFHFMPVEALWKWLREEVTSTTVRTAKRS